MASPQSYMPVLVVDSNASAANELAESVRYSGFEVDVAASGAAARTAMRAQHYGTVVVAVDLSLSADLVA